MEPCKTVPPFPYIPWLITYSDSLLSFGKFLELLVYSQSFHIITPPLCEHIVPVEDNTNIPPSRPGVNIARHFAYRSHLITFTLAIIEEVYNVEVPRVRFVNGAHMSEEVKPAPGSPAVSSQSANSSEFETGDVRRTLKREMRSWWHTLSERIDDLVGTFPCHLLDPSPMVLVEHRNGCFGTTPNQ